MEIFTTKNYYLNPLQQNPIPNPNIFPIGCKDDVHIVPHKKNTNYHKHPSKIPHPYGRAMARPHKYPYYQNSIATKIAFQNHNIPSNIGTMCTSSLQKLQFIYINIYVIIYSNNETSLLFFSIFFRFFQKKNATFASR